MKAVCDLILSVKDAEDHEKWLKTRDLGIGGSDAAAIMSFTGEVMEHRISPNEVVLAYSSSGELSVKFGFKLYLPISSESVSVVTPALKEPPATMKNPTGAEHPKFMATQTWEAVQHLLDETEKYINGRRAQGNLFESDAK